eukprot:1283711-Pyramimonas_sp.AAC.1
MSEVSAVCVVSLQKSISGALVSATAPMLRKFDEKVTALFRQVPEQQAATNQRMDTVEETQRALVKRLEVLEHEVDLAK